MSSFCLWPAAGVGFSRLQQSTEKCKTIKQHNWHAVQYLLNISVERATKAVFLAVLYHTRSCLVLYFLRP